MTSEGRSQKQSVAVGSGADNKTDSGGPAESKAGWMDFRRKRGITTAASGYRSFGPYSFFPLKHEHRL